MMDMENVKVLTFGEVLLRLASPGYTKLFQKDCLETTFCGAEANVAVSLAVLGIGSAMVTKVPDNPVGQAAVNSMRYFGVDASKVLYGDGRLGTYFLEKGASQRPSKVIYDRQNSVFALSQKQEYHWEKLLENTGWFHWTGITAAVSPDMPEICLDACREAKSRGIMVSCDLNYRKNLWDSETAKNSISKIMPYVDVCIANEEDAEKVLGIKAEKSDVNAGTLDKDGYVEVAKKICDTYGCQHIAITLRKSISASRNGWSGMLYSAEKKEAYFSKEYDIQLVDRVGGGDSFGAGLIYGMIKHMDMQEIIEFAVAASCLKQTMEGDYNRATFEEIMDLVKNGGNGRVKR